MNTTVVVLVVTTVGRMKGGLEEERGYKGRGRGGGRERERGRGGREREGGRERGGGEGERERKREEEREGEMVTNHWQVCSYVYVN